MMNDLIMATRIVALIGVIISTVAFILMYNVSMKVNKLSDSEDMPSNIKSKITKIRMLEVIGFIIIATSIVLGRLLEK